MQVKNQIRANQLKPVEKRLSDLELNEQVLLEQVVDLKDEVQELKQVIQSLLKRLKPS